MNTLLDNDILYKASCYRLLTSLVKAIPLAAPKVGILGAASFVILKKIERNTKLKDNQRAKDYLNNALSALIILEPTADELSLAAELEYVAQQNSLNIDQGECQLCAIAVIRAVPFLGTGDKRAIKALEPLSNHCSQLKKLHQKILCLEQLFYRLMSIESPESIKAAVCSEPIVDKALAICFACSRDDSNIQQWLEGLMSYMADLRRHSGNFLMAN